MILNDKFFDREIELKKCFEDGVPLVKFDIETQSYIDCENPNFEESELLKVKIPRFNRKTDEPMDFVKNNQDLIKLLNYKDERYTILVRDKNNPWNISYYDLSYCEMINLCFEHYAFKGTNEEGKLFRNEWCEKHIKDYKYMHFCHRNPNHDIYDFMNVITDIYKYDNECFSGTDLNDLYNLLYVKNETWEKFKKEQRHKELEEKDIEFNENLIYHMTEEEKE